MLVTKMNNLLTTNEVAERLGVSAIRVRQLISEKRLPAQKFGTVYLIKESDLKTVAERPTGRPPKPKDDKAKVSKNSKK